MPTPERLAGVGVFVLGGLLLFTVGLFMIGDRQMAFAKKFTVYTEFKKITGLQPGAIVRVSGAKAGSIKRILPPNTRIEAARGIRILTPAAAVMKVPGLRGMFRRAEWFLCDSRAAILGGFYVAVLRKG